MTLLTCHAVLTPLLDDPMIDPLFRGHSELAREVALLPPLLLESAVTSFVYEEAWDERVTFRAITKLGEVCSLVHVSTQPYGDTSSTIRVIHCHQCPLSGDNHHD